MLPAAPGGAATVITEALAHLNIRYSLIGTAECYNKGQSTQTPVSPAFNTQSRFTRVLIIGKSKINSELISLFPDVTNELNIESVAIVEKDNFVVNLLNLLKEIKPETHTLMFAGCIALSTADISLNSMSEDVDIKRVPTENFMQNSRDKRRKIRRRIMERITDFLHNSDRSSLDNEHVGMTCNEYRYNKISVRYPHKCAALSSSIY